METVDLGQVIFVDDVGVLAAGDNPLLVCKRLSFHLEDDHIINLVAILAVLCLSASQSQHERKKGHSSWVTHDVHAVGGFAFAQQVFPLGAPQLLADLLTEPVA